MTSVTPAPKNPEREFLHEIASPLTTIQLNLGNLTSILEKKNPSDTDEALRILEKCLGQLDRAAEMIKTRRAALIREAEKK
jgi:nitrogen fixation/metabolism regulation signal transduction histidine kinase